MTWSIGISQGGQWSIGISQGTAITPPSTAAYRAKRGLITGFHCFMKQYVDFTKLGLDPLKLPDGTLW